MEQVSKHRIDWIDTAKGICILLVVLQHVSNFTHIDYPLKNDFLTFRMPLYFILSGLFFKTYDGLIGFVKRKINKLIIPYLFFFAVGGVILPVLLYQFWGIRIWSYKNYGFEAFALVFSENTICNPSIWFLFCLFEVNILFFIVQLLANHLRYKNELVVITILSFLCGCFGIFMYMQNINLPYLLDSAFSTLPFFYFGWLLRNKTNFLYWENTTKNIVLTLLLISVSTLFIHFFNHGSLSIRLNSYGGKLGVIEFYPYGIIGTLCVLSLARIAGNIPFVSYLGRYSIIVLCTHAYVIQFSSWMTSVFCVKSLSVVFLVTSIICFAVIPFFKRYLGVFTAQKDLIKVK